MGLILGWMSRSGWGSLLFDDGVLVGGNGVYGLFHDIRGFIGVYVFMIPSFRFLACAARI